MAMGSVRERRRAVLGALVVVLASSGPAAADWPMPRHDPSRTGAAVGAGDLRTPAAYWRYFLGGRPGIAEVIPLELEGSEAVAFVAGGRLNVVGIDGIDRWRSPSLGLTSLVAVADLHGDGPLEVIAQSSAQVFVFDAASGSRRWTQDPGEMGTIGGVRVADVDGDGRADVVVQECACCQVRSGDTGYVYTFAADVAAPPRRAWRIPAVACGGARAMLVADLDGDGDPDLLSSSQDELVVLDGPTGEVVARSAGFGPWASLSYCQAVELVAGGGAELVCALGTTLTTPGAGHRVMAFGYDPVEGRLDLLWSSEVGALDGALVLAADWVHDLDGDGALEVALSGTAADGAPVTVILDAATGAALATIPGQEAVGVFRVASATALLVTHADRELHGWRFQRGAPSPLDLRWRLKNRRVLPSRDWALAAHRPLAARLATADLDGDGRRELMTANTERASDLVTYDGDGTLRATWVAQPDSEVLATWPRGARHVVSSSDGLLTVLAPDVRTAVGVLRAGGYHDPGGWLHLAQAPVAAQLVGDPAHEILVPDSRRRLVALDARGATNAAPPRRLWTAANTSAATIVPGLLGGAPGVACRRVEPTVLPVVERLAVLDGEGRERWQVTTGPLGWNDVLAGNFDGDGVPDLVVQWGSPTDVAVRTTAVAGATGAVLWTQATIAAEARFPSGMAVADWDGDGRDDVVFHHYGLRVLSGRDGAQIGLGGPTAVPYWMPTLHDVTGDGAWEVVLHGGFSPVRTLSHDLSTTLWVSTDDDRPYPYAAVATCGGDNVVASASLVNPSRLKVTRHAPPAGAASTVILAGGRAYASEAEAAAAGARLGQLTSVHVHTDLTGLGRPTAVVGSSDGWLYGVDPCARTLDFAVPFDAPVGAVAIADADGDGLDELVVSVADGYLYGLRHAPLPAPGTPRDLDLTTGLDVDVDEVTSIDTLSVAWDAVPGAVGYEVAVAHAEGGYLTAAPWVEVAATTATLVGLPLVDGGAYRVAVRARSASGRSPDTLSDGVIVRFPIAPDDAGPGDGSGPSPEPGGCCGVGATPGGATTAILVGVVLGGLALRPRLRSPRVRRGRA